MRVAEIAYSPVKGLGLLYPAEIELTRLGMPGNRQFFLVDEHRQMVNGKRLGELVRIVPELDAAANTLTLRLPDGDEVRDVVQLGDELFASFLGRPRKGRLVIGPWDAALSEWAGQPLHLIAPAKGLVGVDRGVGGAVSVAATASVDRLAHELGLDSLERARFRMLFWIDGLEAHAEDAWVEREVALGEATVRFQGHVGRCVVTTQNPATGHTDVDTLAGLKAYRDNAATTAPLALGIWGEVKTPGRVRLGDPVHVLS
jgi:uncharacterized protein YcbX